MKKQVASLAMAAGFAVAVAPAHAQLTGYSWGEFTTAPSANVSISNDSAPGGTSMLSTGTGAPTTISVETYTAGPFEMPPDLADTYKVANVSYMTGDNPFSADVGPFNYDPSLELTDLGFGITSNLQFDLLAYTTGGTPPREAVLYSGFFTPDEGANMGYSWELYLSPAAREVVAGQEYLDVGVLLRVSQSTPPVVPEPSTYAMAGALGLAALVVWRRLRRPPAGV